MRFLLDTSVISEIRKRERADPNVIRWVARTAVEEIGTSVLVLEGTIVNLTTRTLEVPRLRFALRNAAGQEVYAWTAQPTKSTLGSGNGLPFRARLASPPADGRDVIVRFLNRRDVAAGS